MLDACEKNASCASTSPVNRKCFINITELFNLSSEKPHNARSFNHFNAATLCLQRQQDLGSSNIGAHITVEALPDPSSPISPIRAMRRPSAGICIETSSAAAVELGLARCRSHHNLGTAGASSTEDAYEWQTSAQ